MSQYINLVKNIYDNGRVKTDRTGVGTVSIFGHQMRFNLAEGFPVVTEKFTFMRGVIAELLWFISGDTNAQTLIDQNVHIWDEWMVQEDITEEVKLTGYERVLLYAEKTGKAISDIQRDLNIMDARHADSRNLPEDERPISGSAFLDSEGIPSTKTVVKVKKGELGPIYQKQWRAWPNYRTGGTIDQLAEAIELLKNKPNSRRIIVSAWNPADNPDESVKPHINAANGFAALNSCHSFFQFMAEPLTLAERLRYDDFVQLLNGDPILTRTSKVDVNNAAVDVDIVNPTLSDADLEVVVSALDYRNVPKYRLSCQLYQRSADVALGVPFNIASYALLTCMVAQVVNMVPGDFIHTLGDAHLYLNHLSPNGKYPGTAEEGEDTIEDLLERKTLPFPKLLLNPEIKNIDDFTFDDIKIVGYRHSGRLNFPVAV